MIEANVRDLEANLERRLRDNIVSQVRDEFGRELDDIRQQLRGKGPAVSEQSIKTTPPPITDLPTDELKMLLLS